MKIAFCNRSSWNEPLGGDGVQMLETKKALERLYNLEIEIVTEAKDIVIGFDLVHIFNFVTIQETKVFFDKAIELNIPIVSSSIFWDYTYSSNRFINLFIRNHFSGFISQLFRMCIHTLAFSVGYPVYFSGKFKKEYRFFCEKSRMILPNSIEEGHLLQAFIEKIDITNKIQVVYNGVKKTSIVNYLEKENFFSKYNIPENYILQVARIEPVKNQINLIYALKDNKEIPIVFVGKIASKQYYMKLKKLANKRGNVYFVDAVPHDEIDSFYHYAQLHVLLSLRESPGLVSLEALTNDCPIVVANSKYAPVQTYFVSQPYVVDPLNMNEIRSTVLRAYNERKIVKYNMDIFTWDTAAQQTYEAYKKILL